MYAASVGIQKDSNRTSNRANLRSSKGGNVKATPKTSSGLFKGSFVLLLILFGLASHISNVVAQSPGTFTKTGDMISSRSGHTATLLADGRVLIVGGMGGSSTELSSAELYDPDRGTFIRTGNEHHAHDN